MLIIQATDGSQHGAVSEDFLLSLLPLQDSITALPGFDLLCLRAGSTSARNSSCLVYSPLSALPANRSTSETQNKLLQVLSRPSFQARAAVPFEIPTNILLGGAIYDPQGQLKFADAVQMLFIMNPSVSPDALEEFETRFIQLGRAASAAGRRVFVQAPRSYQDESDRIIAEDSPLVAAAIVLMFVYVSVVLGGRPPLKSQIALGMTVVGTVGAAMVVSQLHAVPNPCLAYEAFLLLADWVWLWCIHWHHVQCHVSIGNICPNRSLSRRCVRHSRLL